MSKFNSMIDEFAHRITLDGCCEQIGSVHGIGSHHLVDLREFPVNEKDIIKFGEGLDLTDEDKKTLKKSVGAIVKENTYGFVAVTWYDDPKKMLDDWDGVERDETVFYSEIE